MIIAAIRNARDLEMAKRSRITMIFCLNASILTLEELVKTAHEAGKKIYVHMDLVEGIGKDKPGLEYVKQKGVDGIISTRVSLIKAAREVGLFTVQRFFIVDSQAVGTALEYIKASKPDMIEVMPGTVTKVIADLKNKIDIPIIAGGLIETKQEVDAALVNGAAAVSTSRQELWGRKKRIEYVKG
ncbi:MAG: glycerol-3-phosphate responsive antiterminator [Lachnospiraceae bacterium]|nr:glycerol-3-phosphate responsive antiterminator [Lachnospiraceae bacterium]